MPTITHTPRQTPVAAVMAFLLDQAEATARAIENNACEDGKPLSDETSRAWINRLHMIAGVIARASKTQQRQPCYLPAYPSFTRKELE
jgi:hypothetical protein